MQKNENEKINPITGMDYPDPDVIRVGDTYYMISTTMYYFPGGVILRSYDLVHWEIATYLFDHIENSDAERLEGTKTSYGKGMWAASLRYHNGTFYVAFVSHGCKGTHLFTSDKIEGTWKHSLIDVYMHDCSLLFDEERVFAVYGNTEIHLLELEKNLSGVKKGVVDRIIIRDDKEKVNLGYEGAHFYKINGRYYITLIHWPKYNMKRTEAVFWSDSVEGPYVGEDVFSDDVGTRAGIAQGGLVDTPDGRWFAILFRDSGAVGRVPYLVPVHMEDGKFLLGEDGKLPEQFPVAKENDTYSYKPLYASDDFSYTEMHPSLKAQWQWNHVCNPALWKIENHALWITTGKVSVNPTFAQNTLTQRMLLPESGVTVQLDASGLRDGDYAGLIALQGCYCMVGIKRVQDEFFLFKWVRTNIAEPYQIGYPDYEPGEEVFLEKLEGEPRITLGMQADFRKQADLIRTFVKLGNGEAQSVDRTHDDFTPIDSTSTAGSQNEWREIGEPHQLKFGLDHFTGARFGLCVFSTKQEGGTAGFSDFRYFEDSHLIQKTKRGACVMKKKVALFANGWNGETLDNFIEGFHEYFSNDNVDLFVFASNMLAGHNPTLHKAEDSIYDLPDISDFDAAAIFGLGMSVDEQIPHLVEKCNKAGVPVLLQGGDADGASSVTVDNFIGMKKLCNHLIEEHHVSEVIFIAGEPDNDDSNNRMQALREALNEHGHELKEENIVYACWNNYKVHSFIFDTYGDKKKKLPDAFVCANDQMALSTMAFLTQLGYKIPEEVIVTGFDNLGAGRVFAPSLATVDQCFREQGIECAKFAEEAFSNKKLIKKIVIPTMVNPGESCGCHNCKNEEEARKTIGREFWSSRFVIESFHIREQHLDICITSNERYEGIPQSIKKDFFNSVGQETEDFHLYVNPQYKELKYLNVPEGEIIVPFYNPIMEVIAARTGGVVCDDPIMDVKTLFLGYDENRKGTTYVFTSLIIDNSVFGYMVMGYGKDFFEDRHFVQFAGSIGTTFKQYQRTIEDYYNAIRIKEQANLFLWQTVEALASAVDAKDSYTHGHSSRVAKYAKQIAAFSGLSEEECDDIYLAGLLHDVGKIGIDDGIINKKGKLTDEEFEAIKQHPVLGDTILAKIKMSSNLSVGARHHHERYDGKGYPDGLAGEDIPKIARIIAVADAYDAMTSKRSFRDVLPQNQVRDELVKGCGTQFDPQYAKCMLDLMDMDEEYRMREE